MTKPDIDNTLINDTAEFYARLFSLISYGNRPVIRGIIGYPIRQIREMLNLTMDEFRIILFRLSDIDAFDKVSFIYLGKNTKPSIKDIDIDPIGASPISQTGRRSFRTFLENVFPDEDCDPEVGQYPDSKVFIHCYAENVDSSFSSEAAPDALDPATAATGFYAALPLALPDYQEEKLPHSSSIPIDIKDAVWSDDETTGRTDIDGTILADCEEAIRSRMKLRISWLDPSASSKKASSITVEPIKIIYDYFYESTWLITLSDNKETEEDSYPGIRFFSLDDIYDSEVLNRPILKDIPENLSFLNSLWGREPEKKPTHVRVCFEHTGQVWDRVRNLLSAYVEDDEIEWNEDKLNTYDSPKLMIRSGMLIYEDDIYGLKSFTKYIRAFGDSAYVIAPEKLRNSLYKSAKSGKMVYSKPAELIPTHEHTMQK